MRGFARILQKDIEEEQSVVCRGNTRTCARFMLPAVASSVDAVALPPADRLPSRQRGEFNLMFAVPILCDEARAWGVLATVAHGERGDASFVESYLTTVQYAADADVGMLAFVARTVAGRIAALIQRLDEVREP